MGTQTGKNGQLDIGAETVVQLVSWTLETTSEPIDSSVIGDEWTNSKSSLKSWTMSGEGFYDTADAGTGALILATEVAVTLYPAGNTSGEKDYQGQAYVTAYSEAAGHDTMVTNSFTLQGNGALTEIPVP